MLAPDGSRHVLSASPQGTGCNNEAELRAVTLALEDIRTRGAAVVRVCSDNSIVVAQLSAREAGAAAPIARLAAMFDEARALASSFAHVEMVWVPRSRNAEADALARGALGVGPKQRKAKHLRR